MIGVYRRRPRRTPAGGFRVNLRAQSVSSAFRNSEYWVWLNDMKNFFEQIITGPSFTIDLDIYFQSMSSSILAECGPGTGAWDNVTAFLTGDFLILSGSSAIVKQATMRLNTYYFKQPAVTETDRGWKRSFFQIVVHEFFHAVGFGSLWNGDFRIVSAVYWPWPINAWSVVRLPSVFNFNVVGAGDPWPNPRYTASRGLNAYREQMVGQAGAGSIPIENYGMSTYTTMANAGGAALAHWRQVSGIYDRKGRDIYYEVMTGWSGIDDPEWVSRFTVASLGDIGYTVSLVPTEIPILEYKSVHTV